MDNFPDCYLACENISNDHTDCTDDQHLHNMMVLKEFMGVFAYIGTSTLTCEDNPVLL